MATSHREATVPCSGRGRAAWDQPIQALLSSQFYFHSSRQLYCLHSPTGNNYLCRLARPCRLPDMKSEVALESYPSGYHHSYKGKELSGSLLPKCAQVLPLTSPSSSVLLLQVLCGGLPLTCAVPLYLKVVQSS